MACNLHWSVPTDWKSLERGERIENIKIALRQEMRSSTIDCGPITRLLNTLSRHTSPNWMNRFITTNWDYLLQQEIQQLNFEVQQKWMASSHVFHLNGTVEELESNSNRSQFILEEDRASQRCFTPEANMAYNKILWDRTFVVVGMSFECEVDKFLMNAIGRVKDDLPIGESVWIVVNRNRVALDVSCSLIERTLPHTTVHRVQADFGTWLDSGMNELRDCGAISI
jgi:hypothetical protein